MHCWAVLCAHHTITITAAGYFLFFFPVVVNLPSKIRMAVTAYLHVKCGHHTIIKACLWAAQDRWFWYQLYCGCQMRGPSSKIKQLLLPKRLIIAIRLMRQRARAIAQQNKWKHENQITISNARPVRCNAWHGYTDVCTHCGLFFRPIFVRFVRRFVVIVRINPNYFR